MKDSRILLVEGYSDQFFFSDLLRKIDVSAKIKISAPIDHGFQNNKGGLFTALPILVKQLNDGRLDRISAVVDADHEHNNGMRYSKTLEKITDILRRHGFDKRERTGEKSGFKFKHSDGLNPIGIWIMPDNLSNGGLEEFAIHTASTTEINALDYADKVLKKIPGGQKYSDFHTPKAQAAIWMAW